MNWLLGATVIRKSHNCFLVGENIQNTRWEITRVIENWILMGVYFKTKSVSLSV